MHISFLPWDKLPIEPNFFCFFQLKSFPERLARVNLNDCSYDKDVGASELKSLWQDPDFKAGQEAFYYVRVLENPVCRWSTWDAIRNGEKPRSDLQSTIQERAWTSPIWYTKGV